jgi:mono/diheme cytochrome c family protein
MTNAQKWVAAFLVLFVILFLLQKFTQDDENYEDVDFYGGEEVESSPDDAALSLINRMNCVSCHGVDLKGTNLAPSLYKAKEYWSRDNLINYLRNPASYSGDERFEAYKKEYNSIMPSYSNYDVKDLGKVADYLLGLEE